MASERHGSLDHEAGQARADDAHVADKEPDSSVLRSLRWLPWIVGVALLVAVIGAALSFAEAREFARIAERAKPWWLALAVLLQVCTYAVAGQVLRIVARAGGHSLSHLAALRLGLTRLFIDQAVPSAGLSGTVVLANGLEQRGVPRPVVAAGIVVDLASYCVAYVLSLGLALVVVGIHGKTSTAVLSASLVFFVGAIGIAIGVIVIAGRSGPAAPRLTRFRPIQLAVDFLRRADPTLARSPRLLWEAGAYQLGIILCDAATIWVLVRSLGDHGSATGVFASFMLSNLMRTIGLVPGGLGTFEAASVVTLHMFDLPTAEALAATLLFRGLSFWLPMAPGLWFSRREMSRAAARPHSEE